MKHHVTVNKECLLECDISRLGQNHEYRLFEQEEKSFGISNEDPTSDCYTSQAEYFH